MTEPTHAPAADENQIMAERREKLQALRQHGVAYPNDFQPTHHAADLHERYVDADQPTLEAKQIQIASPAA